MDIFISWSGDRARLFARALRGWLKCVNHAVSPWMSEEDIGPGTRWGLELAQKLQTTHFGIVCLTRESLASPWVLFETGALAKALSEARVCPVLLDVDVYDLPPPIAQFNSILATEQGFFQLTRAVNSALATIPGSKPLDDDLLRRTFEKWWPDLKQYLEALPAPALLPTMVFAGNTMGIEYVYERRSPALEKFVEYLEEEFTKSEYEEDSGIMIVGTSLRAFFLTSETSFDGKEIIRRALETRCPLRILLTEPEVGERRREQEGHGAGVIAGHIRESVRAIAGAGLPREAVRYSRAGPTVFGIATSSRMLLNPYPLEEESHRCFTLIVRRTEHRRDIFHQYRRVHFDKGWERGLVIPDADWGGCEQPGPQGGAAR